MKVDCSKRHLARGIESEHDHAADPDRENVVCRFHDRGRIKIVKVTGFGRFERCRGPLAGGKPCIEIVGVLDEIGFAARNA